MAGPVHTDHHPPFMADLPPAVRDLVTARGTIRRAAAGELVVRQGDPGTEMFVVRSGRFRIFSGTPALGIERELAVVGPGECFGEVALLAGGPRTASAAALEPGELCVLHLDDLTALVAESPAAALAICRTLAGRLQAVREHDRGFHFLHLDDHPDAVRHRGILPPRIAGFCRAVVVEAGPDRARVAMVDPYDAARRGFVQQALRGRLVEVAAISQEDFDRFAALHLRDPLAGGVEEMFAAPVSVVDATGHVHEFLQSGGSDELLADVLRTAAVSGASDLHLEPGEGVAQVRMRIDGLVVPLRSDVEGRLFDRIVSQIKVMSQLDIVERRRPQDGRFQLVVGDVRYEVRVNVLPSVSGENTVLRLLDARNARRRLSDLVLSGPLCERLIEVFQNPSGLILVTGPTGSGKTTTLYAAVDEVWRASQAVNIVTIEDPVEYRLPYATQVQVDRSGRIGFLESLRAALRQDPDVLLVGEIRDADSANIAVEAGTTGHLVLSSMHCDFAIETVARLRRLGVKPFMIAATLRCVVSQRLVPRVCRGCARPAGGLPLVDRLIAQGVLDPLDRDLVVYGTGCELCQGRGQSGRVGAYEVLLIDPSIRSLIEHEAPTSDVVARLTPDNFVSMQRYCRFLLTSGVIAPAHAAECFPLTQRLTDAI